MPRVRFPDVELFLSFLVRGAGLRRARAPSIFDFAVASRKYFFGRNAGATQKNGGPSHLSHPYQLLWRSWQRVGLIIPRSRVRSSPGADYFFVSAITTFFSHPRPNAVGRVAPCGDRPRWCKKTDPGRRRRHGRRGGDASQGYWRNWKRASLARTRYWDRNPDTPAVRMV